MRDPLLSRSAFVATFRKAFGVSVRTYFFEVKLHEGAGFWADLVKPQPVKPDANHWVTLFPQHTA
jgi:hypothetical protein